MSSYSTKAKKVDGKLEKMAKKRVPVNPRYAHVKSNINTGASLSKYLEKLEEIRSNYRFQKNEIFKRMKVTTFAQLIIQVERYKQSQGQFFEDILEEQSETPSNLTPKDGQAHKSDSINETEDGDITPRNDNNNGKASPTWTESDFGGGDQPSSQRSTLQGLICGVGEKDTNTNSSSGAFNSNGIHSSNSNHPSSASSYSSLSGTARGTGSDRDGGVENHPFLLLDCQDEEDFNKCHIVGAINFPKSRLSRAVNYEISPMYDYKNKAGKVIVAYDADEQIAVHVVTSLVERGYDNLFMLSGGLKVTYQKVPTLITGTLPKAALVSNTDTSRSVVGGSKKGSVASEIQLDPEIREHFSIDDVDQIEEELGNSMEGRSTAAPASSRSSRSSVASSHRSSVGAGDGQQTRWK
ncbi:centrosomal protein of 41 kDa-like isoform X2 [Convolutriloba macropyga]|uniref:centrosomal protein of 41 kDa-like isoform X2 n=1 Tax=Convolutriloba macropyga TaxID=536237 RepID=UPI003F5279E3